MKNVLCCVLLGAAVLGCAPARKDAEIARLEKRLAELEQRETADFQACLKTDDHLLQMVDVLNQASADYATKTFDKDLESVKWMLALSRELQAHSNAVVVLQAQLRALQRDNITNRQAIIRLGSRVASR